MNKKKFDELFLRYFWKIIVTMGYSTFIIVFLILNSFDYKLGILDFALFSVFYMACTWQIFTKRGD